MAVNPYASPYYGVPTYKQKQHNVQMVKKYYVLLDIVKHFTKWYDFKDLDNTHGYIRVNNEFFITSKKKTKFRMISRLDWVYYTPKDLARAIETNTVEQYYSQQLADPNSDPNVWRNAVEEYILKDYYAQRVNRQLDLLDNL